jgi:hypothetical protein
MPIQTYRKILWQLCFIGCIAISLLSSLSVVAQSSKRKKDLDQIKTMVRAGDFSAAVPKLKSLRDQEYGKTFEVDYLLGVCLCRTDRRAEGRSFLSLALTYAGVDAFSTENVKMEISWCDSDSGAVRLVKTSPVIPVIRPGTSSTGRKTWFLTHVFRPNETATFRPIKELSSEELDRRLIDLKEPHKAIGQFRSLRLGNFRRTVIVGHFILASTGNLTERNLRQIGNDLEQTLRYFISTFQVQEPRYYITVYMVPHPFALDETAHRIHHIHLDGDTIGYSFIEDLSIAAIVWRMVYGTLKHELFHLLVRSNFGDIPPWLDEGMAALYEQSHQVDGRVVGVRNWRGGILRENWARRPSLYSLLEMDWSSFNTIHDNSKLTTHAMARYFVLYLQEVRALSSVYNALRESRTQDLNVKGSILAVESLFGKNIAEVDADFSQWFLRLPMTSAEDPDK